MSRIIVSINKLHIYIIPEAFFEKKIIQEVKDLGLSAWKPIFEFV